MLRVDPRNPRAQVLHAALSVQGVLGHLPADLCLVIGGDGWMLACIRELGPGPIYLGLNAGHLGFLLNDVTNLDRVAGLLAERRWRAVSFPRLAARATLPDGGHRHTLAVNDLYVERASGQSAHLRLSVDGSVVVDRLVCDGVIVATALGSTAYTFSAGGVPCHPLTRAVQVTPIAPHAPRLSPVVLPLSAAITLEAQALDRRPVRAVADGIDIGPVSRLEVRASEDDVQLAFFEGHAFTKTLVEKVLRA